MATSPPPTTREDRRARKHLCSPLMSGVPLNKPLPVPGPRFPLCRGGGICWPLTCHVSGMSHLAGTSVCMRLLCTSLHPSPISEGTHWPLPTLAPIGLAFQSPDVQKDISATAGLPDMGTPSLTTPRAAEPLPDHLLSLDSDTLHFSDSSVRSDTLCRSIGQCLCWLLTTHQRV